jgi:hypothetical protein
MVAPPKIPALWSLSQEDHKFKTRLGCIVRTYLGEGSSLIINTKIFKFEFYMILIFTKYFSPFEIFVSFLTILKCKNILKYQNLHPSCS